MKQNNESGIAQIIVVIILVLAIIATVVVVSNPKLRSFITKSRADNPTIVVKDANGNSLPQENGLPVTTNNKVQVELEVPPAPN